MKLLKSLFFSNKTNFMDQPGSSFESEVKKAIILLGKNTEQIKETSQAITFLVENNVEKKTAEEIVLFLPIAFVRYLLPQVKWSDSYSELQNDKFVEKKFSATASCKIIWKVTEAYFNDNPDKEFILNIVTRSAEFNAMNPLLLQNPQLQPEEIRFSHPVIIRSE